MKKITSLSLGISFLIMSYTGLMLYIAPQGKVAYWVDWHFLGLTKTQYGELHITSMVTMLVFGALHIYYNWKPLMSYMKDKSKKVSFTKREFLIALALNMVFVLGTLYAVQPVKSILDLEDVVKDHWAQEYGEPPYGHAEESTVAVLSKKQNIDLNVAKANLQKAGIAFSDKDTLLDIALKNNTIPSNVYKIMLPSTDTIEKVEGTPSNLGRRTLKELDSMGKIELGKVLGHLSKKGIESNENSKMKQIADELDTTPLEFYKTVSKKED